MKLQALCRRTTWEIVRDPLNLAFGLGFPLVLLLLLSAIQANVPVDLFAIDRLTPGISVFGLAFIALFSATLVARDRESALLQRLYTAPLTAGDFIFGYVLPLAPMAAVQAAVCYLAAIPLGLTVSVRMLWAVLLDLPAALLFIGLGLLCAGFSSAITASTCGSSFLTSRSERVPNSFVKRPIGPVLSTPRRAPRRLCVLVCHYTTCFRVKKEEIVNFGGLISWNPPVKMSLISKVSRFFLCRFVSLPSTSTAHSSPPTSAFCRACRTRSAAPLRRVSSSFCAPAGRSGSAGTFWTPCPRSATPSRTPAPWRRI